MSKELITGTAQEIGRFIYEDCKRSMKKEGFSFTAKNRPPANFFPVSLRTISDMKNGRFKLENLKKLGYDVQVSYSVKSNH